MTAHRILHIAGTAELTTLVLMLVNLATVHRPAISGVLGPAHGLAYTATVIAGILFTNGRHRVWLLAFVPGIGGLLAAGATTADPESPSRAG